MPAVLSLQRSDSAVWDALDLNMRQTLAYPPAIKPNAPVYVFAYFPADQVNTMPARFTFTIASLGRAVMRVPQPPRVPDDRRAAVDLVLDI